MRLVQAAETRNAGRSLFQRIGGGLIFATGAASLFANWLDTYMHFLDEEILGVILILSGAALVILPASRAARVWQWVLTAFVIAGAIGEASIRLNNWRRQQDYVHNVVRFLDDEDLKYDFKPKTRLCEQGTTNELGMVDVTHAIENSSRNLRIACLGDSVSGDCELFRDNVCVSLEKALPAAGETRKVEALNFSIPGYNTLQEARSLELKAAQFRPDVVVVSYVLNDPYPGLAISNNVPGHLKFEHLLYSMAAFGWARMFGHEDPTIALYYQLHQNERIWTDIVVRGFDRIEAFARPRGIPVVIAIFPQFLRSSTDLLPKIYRQVADEATRHGFVAVDLSTEAYANEPLESLLKPSLDPTHPNARAHELAAQAIARRLIAAHPELLRH